MDPQRHLSHGGGPEHMVNDMPLTGHQNEFIALKWIDSVIFSGGKGPEHMVNECL